MAAPIPPQALPLVRQDGTMDPAWYRYFADYAARFAFGKDLTVTTDATHVIFTQRTFAGGVATTKTGTVTLT